jgi:hypothetical protein
LSGYLGVAGLQSHPPTPSTRPSMKNLKTLIPTVAEKNILILVEKKNNKLIQSFCHMSYC